MSRQSYMTGFCKAASAAGVDPRALAKYAQVDERFEDGILRPAIRKAYPGDSRYLDAEDAVGFSLMNNALKQDKVGREAIEKLLDFSAPSTVADVMVARNSVLNPTEGQRLAFDNLPPRMKAVYTAGTNSFDVATKPFVGKNERINIDPNLRALRFLAGIRNFENHPALQPYKRQAPKK